MLFFSKLIRPCTKKKLYLPFWLRDIVYGRFWLPTYMYDLHLIFCFRTNGLKSKDLMSLSRMAYQLRMHITYIKFTRGNNSRIQFSYAYRVCQKLQKPSWWYNKQFGKKNVSLSLTVTDEIHRQEKQFCDNSDKESIRVSRVGFKGAYSMRYHIPNIKATSWETKLTRKK